MKHNKNRLVIGCLITAVVLTVLLIILLVIGFRAFVNYGIASDLNEYIREIHAIKFNDQEKSSILSALKELRRQAKQGDHVSVNSWSETNDLFRKVLADKVISESEIKKIKKEIAYLQQNINSKTNQTGSSK